MAHLKLKIIVSLLLMIIISAVLLFGRNNTRDVIEPITTEPISFEGMNNTEICLTQGFDLYERRGSGEDAWDACCRAKTATCQIGACVTVGSAKEKRKENWSFPPC